MKFYISRPDPISSSAGLTFRVSPFPCKPDDQQQAEGLDAGDEDVVGILNTENTEGTHRDGSYRVQSEVLR